MQAHPAVTLRFLGAAGTVSGSRFLVDGAGARLLIDCGMFQGARPLRRANWEPFPVPIESIQAVVLSHAHLDHAGWLPRLVRQGYRGLVLCSQWTAQLAPIVLRDAAHLQEEEAEYAAVRGSSRHHPPLPLFDRHDAEHAIKLLSPVAYGEPVRVVPDMTVRLHRAGHILGSSTVEVAVAGRTLTFSGDLGRAEHPLLDSPEPLRGSDAIVVESTYGDRRHPPRDLTRLAVPVRRALERGGSVLIPAFAIDRTEVVLMALRELMSTGDLPVVPVYVDSPMALAALKVYRHAVAGGSAEIEPAVRARGGDPFDPGLLRPLSTPEESIALADRPGPYILISASGMATGGRVLHHLTRLAPDPRHLIVLPGFQAPGTRGRSLLDGAPAVKIFGSYVPVRAEVLGFDDLSAHADADNLLDWLRTAPRPPATCYLVHGEPPAAAALAARIRKELDWCAVVPDIGEQVIV